MRTMLLLAVMAICQSVLAVPTFGPQYFLTGVFKIPYFNIYEPLDVYYDAVNNRQRIDFYGGMDTYIYRLDTGNAYEIVPKLTEKICMTSSTSGMSLVTIVPDLSDWDFMGPAVVKGTSCLRYQLVVNELNNKNSTYTFYTTNAGYPVQFVMQGIDSVFDSHPDLYIIDYDTYVEGFNDSAVFNAPTLCNNAKAINPGMESGLRGSLSQLGRLIPQGSSFRPKDTSPMHLAFNLFMSKYGKMYGSVKEYNERLNTFTSNAKFIADFNNKDNSFKLAMNHFGDVHEEEFRRMLPKVTRPANNGAHAVHSAPQSVDALPSWVDWRTKGAVTPIKDQGSCGSCWTFGTAGSIEGAWAVKYGKLIPLSEQQILDCSWANWGGEGGNLGCDGGYASAAMQWIVNNGGLATEGSYPYLQQDGWCDQNDRSSGIALKGYVNVTSGSEAALQSAVASNGPVAVAIDAAHLHFRFYASGVYYNPACKNDVNDLDHEVLAVGYGSDSGQDYWIVKNSWSPHWGHNGYIWMARNRNNNCGIATQATYPMV